MSVDGCHLFANIFTIRLDERLPRNGALDRLHLLDTFTECLNLVVSPPRGVKELAEAPTMRFFMHKGDKCLNGYGFVTVIR